MIKFNMYFAIHKHIIQKIIKLFCIFLLNFKLTFIKVYLVGVLCSQTKNSHILLNIN